MTLEDRIARARFVPPAVRGFFGMPGSRPWLVLFCLGVASIAEGLGFASLLPVLAIATGEGAGGSGLQRAILDLVEGFGFEAGFGTLATVVAAAMVFKALVMVAVYRVVAATASGVTAELRRQLVANLLRARWPYFVRQPAGRFANAMGVEAIRCGNGYLVSANFFVFTIQSLAYLAVAFLVSWRIAAMALVIGGIVALVLHGFVRRARKSGFKSTRRSADMTVLLADTLASIKPIKAMGRERGFLGYIDRHVQAVRRALRQQMADREALSSLQEALMAALLAFGFWLAHGVFEVPAAQLVVSGLLLARAATTVNKVQKAYQASAQLWPSYEHVSAIVAETAAMAEEADGGTPPRLVHGIRFEKVSFAHGERPVFRDLDLDIPAGRITVLTGPSGVGKTTLVDLVLGLLDPGSGRILVDGVPLSRIDRRAWRRILGYAPQDPVLLHASVRENLTLGDSSVEEEAILRALAVAEARGFVERLPEGLETVVGERGAALSGGQRQRLALARALVHRPRLLVLDEVTSALDAETEKRICDNLVAMPDRPTILAVTHRPAWLAIADRIVELGEGGRVQVRARAEAGSATAVRS
jgi:ATP-binding cassette subfamily C protein